MKKATTLSVPWEAVGADGSWLKEGLRTVDNFLAEYSPGVRVSDDGVPRSGW